MLRRVGVQNTVTVVRRVARGGCGGDRRTRPPNEVERDFDEAIRQRPLRNACPDDEHEGNERKSVSGGERERERVNSKV